MTDADAARHKRRIALTAIDAHARAALHHQQQILKLARAHELRLALPPDQPFLELVIDVAALKESEPELLAPHAASLAEREEHP